MGNIYTCPLNSRPGKAIIPLINPLPMGERRQRSGRRSRDNARIASERMAILFAEAERSARQNEPGLSGRYVRLARSIGMRYNVRLPAGLRRRACRKCGAFLVPGKNLRVRLRGGKTVWTCLKCDARRTLDNRSAKRAGGKVKRSGERKRASRGAGKPENRRADRETGEPGSR
jgi:ribonuclease P protein subunit RPR2